MSNQQEKPRGTKNSQPGQEPLQQAQSDEQFQWLGERRHMHNAPYVLPSDSQEINRLDFQHFMLRQTLRGNYVAPIRNPATILDVGSGTGRWAVELAQQFPHAHITGCDITPPALTTTQTFPENYTFVKGNILEGLPFANSSFDFVHMRLLLFAIPTARWPVVIQELLRVTRPGGWIESVETGPQQNCGPTMDELVRWITLASNNRGIDPLLGPHVKTMFYDAGLAHMQTKSLFLPVGKYGGRLGMMAQTDVIGVVKGVKQLVVAQGIASATQYDDLVRIAQADLEQYKGRLPFYITYGQRRP